MKARQVIINKSECAIENKPRDVYFELRGGEMKDSSERRIAVSCRRRELLGWFTGNTSMGHQVLLTSKAG